MECTPGTIALTLVDATRHPPCPKKTYRSHYVYRGATDLDHPVTWAHVSDFDLVLRLIDFDGLRPVLAQRLGWVSARGYEPFDPLSFFLLLGWQITNHWNRTETLRHLAEDRYTDYAQRFGFANGIFPTEGGVRYFLTALGQHSEGDPIMVDEEQQIEVAWQRLNELIVQSVELIHAAGVFSVEAWPGMHRSHQDLLSPHHAGNPTTLSREGQGTPGL